MPGTRPGMTPSIGGTAQKCHPPLIMADVALGALGFEAGLAQAAERRGLAVMRQPGSFLQPQVVRGEDPQQPEGRRPEEAVGGSEAQQRQRSRRCRETPRHDVAENKEPVWLE